MIMILLFYLNYHVSLTKNKEYFINQQYFKKIPDNKNKIKILAIGDIHGNKDTLLNILKKNNLIDTNENWISNNSVKLIQVGDVIDRGAKSLESLLLLRKIQLQAKNGQVIRLLGNHEIMILEDDYRFINKKTDTYEKIKKIKKILQDDIQKGLVKISYSFNNLLFSHAGVTRNFLKKSHISILNTQKISQELNKRVLNILYTNNYLNDKQIIIDNNIYLSNIGPFWARTSEIFDEFPYNNFIQIIGHTPKNKIKFSPSGGAIYIDTGIFINNRLSFLEISNGKFISHSGDLNNIKKEIIN